MNLNSIRWRLPFSYAAIALLAALALGSVMLLVLSGYYAAQERAYLTGNAVSLSPMIERLLNEKVSAQFVTDQVAGLAFLSQTRIRVLDPSGQVITDSGIPDVSKMISVSGGTAAGQMMFSMPSGGSVKSGTPMPVFEQDIVTAPEAGLAQPMGNKVTAKRDTIFFLNASPYGYGFVGSAETASNRRSSQVVNQPLPGSLGTLEISGGPAYGDDILDAVSMAWLTASVIAILLAALAGWVASRDVTRPVLALTDATRQMERGNLSMRANLPGTKPADEFHTLALSFNSMAQRVEDTVSTLRAFVSDAAHELNTPLTALKTNLELAANETDNDQQAVFLARAIEQNRRLELLTAGLLDLSRIEVSQSAPDPEPVRLRMLVAQAGERFASRAEQAERTFVLDLPEAEITVHGNHMQLQRALDNLLENALKFTPKGGEICLQVEQKDDQVFLIVTDTGIGIPSEDLPHLFGRFRRGRNSSEYPGNGLGLAIVKAIAAAHGGQVHVESAGRQRGSRFTLVLPKG